MTPSTAKVRRRGAAGRGGDVGRGPERGHCTPHLARDLSATPARRRHRRTAGRGRRRSGPVSWPLPAISTMSPGPLAAIAARIAARRSPISVAPGAAARIAARIAAGSSLRGLSSVTMTSSALRDRDRAHQRPLAGVAVAARAEHDAAAPRHAAAARRSPPRARRACAHSRRRPARPTARSPRARAARAPAAAARGWRSVAADVAAGRDHQPGRDQRVRRLIRADQRQIDAMRRAVRLDVERLPEQRRLGAPECAACSPPRA